MQKVRIKEQESFKSGPGTTQPGVQTIMRVVRCAARNLACKGSRWLKSWKCTVSVSVMWDVGHGTGTWDSLTDRYGIRWDRWEARRKGTMVIQIREEARAPRRHQVL